MKVFKLNHTHSSACAELFSITPYWSPIKNTVNRASYSAWRSAGYSVLTYNMFVDNYLSNVDNFHAYGGGTDSLNTVIYFYESAEEPAWYLLGWRNRGTAQDYITVLDHVLEHNENNNRFKFYALEAPQHVEQFRKEVYSHGNMQRYGVVDEYTVGEKSMCYYTNAWELLYKRMLIPETTQVACYYLQQQWRTVSSQIGGNL